MFDENLMLPEYKSLSDILFKNKSALLIPNCTKKHNVILHELILKYTEDNGTVYIYSNNFDDEIFDDESFLEEVKKSLDRGIKFNAACTRKCKSEKFNDLIGGSVKENVNELYMEEKGKKVKIEFFTNGTAVSLNKDGNIESVTSGNDPKAGEKLISAFFHFST